MSFNDQVQNLRRSGTRFSVFKDGVKTKWLTGQNGILFRILPAYNYTDTDGAGNVNPAGYLPCRTPTGELTSWGIILRIARYIGHGNGKAANRKDFISPITFTNDEKTFDPVAALYQTAAMYPEWQYLVEDRREGGEKGRVIERAALTRASEFLAINIVELGGVSMPECVIGLCTKSTTDGLVNKEKGGLVYQRANNVTQDLIRQNPMLQWALGDITDPTNGPVFYVMKGTDRGEFSGYQVGVAVDHMQQVRHYPVGPDLLALRYDLTRADNVALKPDDAQTVQELVETFNMRSPNMHHEYELLKLAFGDYFKIPDAPAAPAAARTVAAGYGGPGAGSGFGPAPGTPPTPPEQGILFPPGPAAPGMAFTPPVAGGFPKAAGPVGPAPQMRVAGENAQAAAAPISTPVPPPAAPQTQPAAPASTPVAPGDAVGGFDRQAFLGRLNRTQGAAPAPQG